MKDKAQKIQSAIDKIDNKELKDRLKVEFKEKCNSKEILKDD